MDIEGWLAKPIRWLAKWAGVSYDGEWRNGQVAHLFAGWSLILTAGLIWKWLMIPVFIYPFFRELQDCKFNEKNWTRKSDVDLGTFLLGEIIGLIFYKIGG